MVDGSEQGDDDRDGDDDELKTMLTMLVAVLDIKDVHGRSGCGR